MSYVDGYVVPVPTAKKQAYRDAAAKLVPVYREYGALRVVEAWGDDVPPGKVTDFQGAVKATPEETVVFSWIEWPSKEVREAATKKMRDDPRMKMDPNGPFDGKRLIYGGFDVMLDERKT